VHLRRPVIGVPIALLIAITATACAGVPSIGRTACGRLDGRVCAAAIDAAVTLAPPGAPIETAAADFACPPLGRCRGHPSVGPIDVVLLHLGGGIDLVELSTSRQGAYRVIEIGPEGIPPHLAALLPD
jgi:hypothetical protein